MLVVFYPPRTRTWSITPSLCRIQSSYNSGYRVPDSGRCSRFRHSARLQSMAYRAELALCSLFMKLPPQLDTFSKRASSGLPSMCAHVLSLTPQGCGATNASCYRALDLDPSELQSTYDFFNSHRYGMMGPHWISE